MPASFRDHTRLVDLKRRELWVEVGASVWGGELRTKPRILELERALGAGESPRDVRLQLGPP